MTQISDALIQAARIAAQRLEASVSKMFLEAPFDGFYVTAEKIPDEKVFKAFSGQELGVDSETIFLYCDSLWGQKKEG